MNTFINTVFATLLCGQFLFRVGAYFIDGIRPSIPFWFAIYGCSAIFLIVYKCKLSKESNSLWIFFSYILTWAFIDFDNNFKYISSLVIFCIVPYICGNIMGRFISLTFFKAILFYAFICIIFILYAYQLVPYAFDSDRFFIFASKNWDRNGGDPTGIYLGLTFGCSLIILASFNMEKKSPIFKISSYIFIAAIIFILISFCSRSAIIASYIGLLFIFLCEVCIEKKFNATKLILIILMSIITMFSMSSRRTEFVLELYKNVNLFNVNNKLKQELLNRQQQELLNTQQQELLNRQQQELLNTRQQELLNRQQQELPNTQQQETPNSPINLSNCLRNGESIGNRLVLYSEAIRIYKNSPIVGVGPGGYSRLYCGDKGDFISPHFLLLQIFVEFGVIGLVLFIYFIIKICKIVIKKLNNKNIRLLFSLWIFFFLIEQFSGNIYYAYHLFLISGILTSFLSNIKNE